MNRKEVIEAILFYVDLKDEDIIITSPGMISREVFQLKDRPRNFYVMGSMGATVSIAIGIALNTRHNVYVILGDGDALMDLGALVLAKKLALKNLFIHIIDNKAYASTGNQKTISDSIDFKDVGGWVVTVHHTDSEKGIAPRIPLSPMEIKTRFMNAVKN